MKEHMFYHDFELFCSNDSDRYIRSLIRIKMRRILPSILMTVLAWAFLLVSGASQPLSVTLNAPVQNGSHIGCFGMRTGSITATVTGGVGPYRYRWSNNDTTGTVTGLAAGYYRVLVTDGDSTQVIAEITLDQPAQLAVGLDPFEYPNGYHISCRVCYNGNIQVVVSGGIAPYSYLWGDGASTPSRSGLGSATYRVTVTDANGCTRQSQSL